jgi:hypothetical protein
MSDELRERLSRHLGLKAVKKFFSTFTALELVDFLEDTQDPFVEDVWHEVAKFTSIAYHKLPEESSVDEINSCLQDALSALGIDDEMYISIAGAGNVPWTKVKIIAKNSWCEELFKLGKHDFIILNIQRDKAVALLEEEYYFEFHTWKKK